MKYLIDGKEATREEVIQHLQEEYDLAKDSPYFQGRIFYNLDYLEHTAKKYMGITNSKDWASFSLRFIAE